VVQWEKKNNCADTTINQAAKRVLSRIPTVPHTNIVHHNVSIPATYMVKGVHAAHKRVEYTNKTNSSTEVRICRKRL